MASPGNIEAKLTLNNAQFESAIASTVQSLGALGGSMGSAVLALGAVGIAVGATVKIIQSSVSGYQELGSSVLRLKTITGATAEESSRFVNVAENVGVSTQSLTRVFTGLSRQMTRQPEVFKALGISIDDVGQNGRSMIDVFKEVISVAQKQASTTDRNTIAFKTLGVGAASALPFLQLTKEQMDAIEESAQRIFSDEDLKKQRELNIAYRELSETFKAMGDNIARVAVPAITWLGQNLRAVVTQTKDLLMLDFDAFMKDGIDNIQKETKALATLKEMGEETSDALDELSAVNQKIANTSKNFAITVRESMAKQKDQVIDLKKSYVKNLGDIKDQFTELAKKHKDTIADITNDLSKLKSEYEESNKSRQDSYKESLADEIKTHQDSLKDKKDELAKMTAFGQEINEVEIANLQKKIAEEQAFLTKHAADAKGVQAELSTDSIDELKTKFAKENSEATKNYNERVAELKKSQEKENESYTTQTSKLSAHLSEIQSEYSENLQKIHDDFVDQMSSMMAKMDAPMDKIKAKLEALGDPDVMKVFNEAFPQYEELVKGFTDSATQGLATTAAAAQKCNQSLAQLLSQNSGMSIGSPFITGSTANKTSTAEIITQQSSSPGIFSGIGNVLKSGVENIRKLFSFEQGGVVPRTGLIYAHAGEVVVPKGGSNGATVNFYGDTHFNSKEDEDRFVNKIRKVLMQDNDNAKLGIY